eukprot:TRINITY_DN2191_c0_g1_i4.p1 TRINITY_DN2191_c0_g1~~TRINITY_DN2191_c0_g1_i4.p1  ORF type:complete len:102 (+),score=8.81 TRINITY_DN2191_c0_g1_i4:3-308(+)
MFRGGSTHQPHLSITAAIHNHILPFLTSDFNLAKNCSSLLTSSHVCIQFSVSTVNPMRKTCVYLFCYNFLTLPFRCSQKGCDLLTLQIPTHYMFDSFLQFC